MVLIDAHFYDITRLEPAAQDFLGERIFDLLLDRALERSRTIHRIKTCVSQSVARRI